MGNTPPQSPTPASQDEAQVLAAACRYLLVALLPPLERLQPGIVTDLRAGIEADRAALLADGKLSAQMAAVISEAQRILDLGTLQ